MPLDLPTFQLSQLKKTLKENFWERAIIDLTEKSKSLSYQLHHNEQLHKYGN